MQVYGVAKHERIHVSCEVLANPKDGGVPSLANTQKGNGLRFEWVFNSSSERIDLPQDRVQVSGSRSLAEHMPKVILKFEENFSIFHKFVNNTLKLQRYYK